MAAIHDESPARAQRHHGVLYWLAGLPPDRASLGEVRFTWQSH